MTTEKIDAYWFAKGDSLPNGDGRQIVIGKKHSLHGDIIICRHALHASRDPFDALHYALGPYLYKVRCWGDVIEQKDKLGARHREYVAMRDATSMLWRFAREQALSVIHLWDAPDIVVEYLKTGNEKLRIAARSAAWRAAWRAAWGAAWSAAWSAAEGAAESAAWRAAESAARSAAESAARSAAERAAWRAAERAAWRAARTRFSELVTELFADTGNA